MHTQIIDDEDELPAAQMTLYAFKKPDEYIGVYSSLQSLKVQTRSQTSR